MKNLLLTVLRDRKTVAAIAAAVLGGLGLSLTQAQRDALWNALASLVGG